MTQRKADSVTTPIEDIGPPPWFGERVPKPTRTIPPMPQRADLVEGQFLVVPVSEPDEFNRVSFFAYWLDSATPDGVRGQRFHTQLEKFSADRNVKIQPL